MGYRNGVWEGTEADSPETETKYALYNTKNGVLQLNTFHTYQECDEAHTPRDPWWVVLTVQVPVPPKTHAVLRVQNSNLAGGPFVSVVLNKLFTEEGAAQQVEYLKSAQSGFDYKVVKVVD